MYQAWSSQKQNKIGMTMICIPTLLMRRLSLEKISQSLAQVKEMISPGTEI